VFLVNSRFPPLSATTTSSHRKGCSPAVAPLLPKLRGQFAEFLNHSSPDRLSILYLTTCVGLGYGPRTTSLEAFLGSIGSSASPDTARHHVSPTWCADLPTHRATRLPQDNHRLGPTTFLRHPITHLQTQQVPAPTRSSPKGLPRRRRLVVGCSAWALLCGYGNINPLSIDYASRPRLRPRLTQSR
jgi:hypothetical protein